MTSGSTAAWAASGWSMAARWAARASAVSPPERLWRTTARIPPYRVG